jgi:hypothetical protein
VERGETRRTFDQRGSLEGVSRREACEQIALGMARFYEGPQLPFEHAPIDLIPFITFGPQAIFDIRDVGAGARLCKLERALHRGQLVAPRAKHLVDRLH